MLKVHLKKDRDQSIKRKHPWIFSGAIEKYDSGIQSGSTVTLLSSSGKVLGKGAFSPKSQIAVRMWTFNGDDDINTEFFHRKISAAINIRSSMLNEATNCCRIINSESDGLPGLIVDMYNDILVCQFLSAGAEFWKEVIVNHLTDILKPKAIYERSDSDVRLKEGLDPKKGILYGSNIAQYVQIVENGMKFFVDIENGHKTGFYLDQKDNRSITSTFVKDKSVLNCFSYTGGFSVYALSNDAREVINIDTSASVLELLNKNIQLNDLDIKKSKNLNDDVFKALRKFRDERRTFDVIILDPPKFAESANQVKQASRGYKDINLLAMKLLNEGGTLVTFSCSGHISTEFFQKIISDAAIDSGKEFKVVKKLTQSEDHTVTLNFPESMYLKGLVLRSF